MSQTTEWEGGGDGGNGGAGGAGSDPTAIHSGIADEFGRDPENVFPVAADEVLTEDSTDGKKKKRVALGLLPWTPMATAFIPGPFDGTFSISAIDNIVYVTGGEQTLTSLPAAASVNGRVFGVFKAHGGVKAVKFTVTIGGSVPADLIEPGDGFIFQSDSGAYRILARIRLDELRPLDDSITTATNLFSAFKIMTLIDAVVAGIDVHDPVATGTLVGDGNITLSGEQTIRGVTTSASRVLLNDQTVPAENGAWVTAAGAWTRPADFVDPFVTNGASFTVLDSGSTIFRTQFILTTLDPITVDTTPLSFAELPPVAFGTTAGTATEGNDPRVLLQDENDAALGTDGTPSTSNRYVTNSDPRNTNARTPVQATESVVGGAEIATQAETDVGTDDTRFVTPLKLATTPVGKRDLWEPWNANVATFPATNPAAADSRNAHPILAFDATTAENIVFHNLISRDYLDGALSVDVDWVAATATTGVVQWDGAFERIAPGGQDIDSDGFAAVQVASSTTSATSGVVTRTTITFTQAQADAIEAGDTFRFRLTRNTSVGSNMAGDAQVLRVAGRQ